MADAAEGKQQRGERKTTRLLLLPATGAAVYALVKSDLFSRQAKRVVGGARSLADELPDELMARVQQATTEGAASSGNGSSTRRSRSSSSTGSSRRKTSTSKSRSRTRSRAS